DEKIGRLNKEGTGKPVGKFDVNDKIIVFYENGSYELTDYELTNRYEPGTVLHIEKFNPEKIISVIYLDAAAKRYYAKRFLIESQNLKTPYSFIKDGAGNKVVWLTTLQNPQVVIRHGKKKAEWKETILFFADSIEKTGWKTIGTKLEETDIKEVETLNTKEKNEDSDKAPTLF